MKLCNLSQFYHILALNNICYYHFTFFHSILLRNHAIPKESTTIIEEETLSHMELPFINIEYTEEVARQPFLMSHVIAKEKNEEVAMVTGASGFLGQHIVKLLHERAPHIKEIRVFDIKPFQQKLGKCVLGNVLCSSHSKIFLCKMCI